MLRGNVRAARAINNLEQRRVSIITYMGLIQGARSKREARTIRGFLVDLHFQTLPLTENIGHRASIYMEEYAVSGGMTVPDALIAATAAENEQPLLTGNRKHYRPIRDLDIRPFRA